MRILIADDHQDSAASLAELLHLLQPGDAMTVIALDGAEAVESARDARPDAVLLDLAMPNLDGVKAAHRIRQMHGRQVAIAGLSGHRDRVAEAQGNVDFDDVFHKPASVEDLLGILRLATELKQRAKVLW